MGLLDKLGIGGSKDERETRAAAKLRKKATEKYGPPENRQGAIEELGEMRTPRAIEALLMRYTVRVEGVDNILRVGWNMARPGRARVKFGVPLHLHGDDYADLARQVEDAVKRL